MGGAWTLGWWLSGDERQIHDKLQERLPHLTVKAVLPTPAQGVYAVETENEEAKKILHATADGSYVIAGDLYEITKEGTVNLTETRREEQRREMLKQVDKKEKITYSSEGDPQAVVVGRTASGGAGAGHVDFLSNGTGQAVPYSPAVQYAHLKLIDALLPGRSLNTTTPSRSISMVPFSMLRSFAFTVMASVGNHE